MTTLRTASINDLPRIAEIYRSASLSNPGDSALLAEHPELLQFECAWPRG